MSTAQRRLAREFQLLARGHEALGGVVAAPRGDDLFVWRCAIAGPPDTPYEHGVYEATLTFPKDYPLAPPKMRFTTEIWHPNVYTDGRVCISILHAPGEDPMHYESADERWGPLQSVDKVLLSVAAMLAEPNCESPANVEAAREMRVDPQGFDKRVRGLALKSLGAASE